MTRTFDQVRARIATDRLFIPPKPYPGIIAVDKKIAATNAAAPTPPVLGPNPRLEVVVTGKVGPAFEGPHPPVEEKVDL